LDPVSNEIIDLRAGSVELDAPAWRRFAVLGDPRRRDTPLGGISQLTVEAGGPVLLHEKYKHHGRPKVNNKYEPLG
jgi:hypothetical protein